MRPQRHFGNPHPVQEGARIRQRRRTPLLERERHRIGVHRFKYAIQDQSLIANADRRKFSAGAFRLRQGRRLCPADQHEGRAPGICQGGHGIFIDDSLLFQSCERAETGSARGAGGQKPRPRAGQGQQPQRVSGGRGVEDHLVVAEGRRRVAEQPGKLIEGGDLHRARAGKLLLHAPYQGLGQLAAIGADQFFPVGRRRPRRVNIQGVESRDIGNPGRGRRQAHAQHFVEI